MPIDYEPLSVARRMAADHLTRMGVRVPQRPTTATVLSLICQRTGRQPPSLDDEDDLITFLTQFLEVPVAGIVRAGVWPMDRPELSMSPAMRAIAERARAAQPRVISAVSNVDNWRLLE